MGGRSYGTVVCDYFFIVITLNLSFDCLYFIYPFYFTIMINIITWHILERISLPQRNKPNGIANITLLHFDKDDKPSHFPSIKSKYIHLRAIIRPKKERKKMPNVQENRTRDVTSAPSINSVRILKAFLLRWWARISNFGERFRKFAFLKAGMK